MTCNNDTHIDIRMLSTINKFAQKGTDGIEENLAMLADDASLRVSRFDCIDIVKRHEELSNAKHAATRARLQSPPEGHLVITMQLNAAQKVTQRLMNQASSGDQSQEMAQDAFEELANMMVSGFLDAWADTMGETIDHSSPDLKYAPKSRVIKKTASIGENRTAILFEIEIEADGVRIPAEVYLFPDTAQFTKIIRTLHKNDGV